MTDFLTNTVAPWSGKLALAVLIFLIGRVLIGWVTEVIRGLLRQATLDETMVGFVTSIAHGLLLLTLAVTALSVLGVDTTALIALVGAAGLAIGLALKDSLGNFAAGFMLIVFRPFKVGDTVEAGGVTGTVRTVNIFNTRIDTFDNKAMFVPNGSIHNGTIINYSTHPTRRLDLTIDLDYGDDLTRAKQLLAELVAADDRLLVEPEPVIAVGALADSSVQLELRVWVLTDQYMTLKFDLLERIKSAFDQQGLSLPYPQLAVHLSQPAAVAEAA